MHEVKRQVDGFHPTRCKFKVKPAVRLLKFLSTLRDAFEMIGVRKAAAIGVFACFIEGEAKEVLLEKMEETVEEYASARTMVGTRADARNISLKRLLTDDILKQSSDSVARDVQKD